MMKFAPIALLATAVATSGVSAFITVPFASRSSLAKSNSLIVVHGIADGEELDPKLAADIESQVKYIPGGADTEFARRYRHLVGAKVKTVAESFAEFTRELGYSVNPLYKNMVTDIVGTTHLVVVSARFQRDAVWCLGLLTVLDLLLKNYPERDVADRIVSALFKCINMNESEVRAEAKVISDWAQGKTRAEVETALQGEGDSPLAQISKAAKADEFWLYSRYFGIGLVKIMEIIGIEMEREEVYPIMEDWMSNKLGHSPMTACSDSDMFFKAKARLDMMETLMKEIEIREKKRMAERLERKADEALRQVEKEEKMEKEIEAEAAKNRERVATK